MRAGLARAAAAAEAECSISEHGDGGAVPVRDFPYMQIMMPRRDSPAARARPASDPHWMRLVSSRQPALSIVREPEPARRQARAGSISIVGALALAAVVRLTYLQHFPLHDGGLFYAMIGDVRRAHLALPQTTTYNGGGIPFAYPPLGIYVGALLGALGVDPVDVLRFVPLVVSLGSLLAFAAIAHDVLPSRRAATFATLLFAVEPRAFDWVIMGGGITRAFGQLFGLLTIWATYRLFVWRRQQYAVAIALFGSLTVLSHLEWSYFAAYSAMLMLVLFRPGWRTTASAVVAGAGVVVLTMPWWLTVLSRDGFEAFFSAAHSGASGTSLPIRLVWFMTFHWSDIRSAFFPLSIALGAFGIVGAVRTRSWLPIAWLALVFLAEQRGTWNRTCVPVTLLGGIALADLESLMGAAPRWGGRAVPLFLVGVCALIALVWPRALMQPPSAGERAAMAWAAANTPRSGQFLIVSGNWWGEDAAGEWFPALSLRSSVTTVQGYEWLPGMLDRRAAANAAAQSCGHESSECIIAWSATYAAPIDYVFVARRPTVSAPDGGACCESLRRSLSGDPRFARVFDNDDASIFRFNR